MVNGGEEIATPTTPPHPLSTPLNKIVGSK